MAYVDYDLEMFEDGLVASATSDVIKFPQTTESSTETNSPANYVNIEITGDTTGALTTTIQDSADNSSYAAVSGLAHTFASDAVAGTGVSLLLPVSVRQYMKAVNTTATGGTVSVWIGQKKF